MAKTLTLIVLIVICSLSANAQSFDWDSYVSWVPNYNFKKTYVVNQKHPKASDTNAGTEDAPLFTINAAAQLVAEGERVLIHEGEYRELIAPKLGGSSLNAMISYEAADGEIVIVKGSRIFKSRWATNLVINEKTKFHASGVKIWIAQLPDSLFESEYFPFALSNIEAADFVLMPWAEPEKNNVPFTLPRGLIFQNGKRMIQLSSKSDLPKLEGSYWVDRANKLIYIYPFGGLNPNETTFEIAVQSHLFKPQSIGLGYVRIKGIVFEHCANSFLRTSSGAVNIMGGHHWVIENNTIKDINSSGLEFGYKAYEYNDKRSEKENQKNEDIGFNMIRNNRIHDCGTAGIRSLQVSYALVENNEIWNCGWQDAEFYWECAGIKLLICKNTLVRNNHIYNIVGGAGIWLDWDNKNSRVTRNFIHNISTVQGAVFVEASRKPNLVDNNVIWSVIGNGIFGNDSENQLYVHNLVGNISNSPLQMLVGTDRIMYGKPMTNDNNLVKNNVFVDCHNSINTKSTNSSIDYNLYVNTLAECPFDFDSIQRKGTELHSQKMDGKVKFNVENGSFKFKSEKKVKGVPNLEFVKSDYYNSKRNKVDTSPGPFVKLKGSHFYKIKD